MNEKLTSLEVRIKVQLALPSLELKGERLINYWWHRQEVVEAYSRFVWIFNIIINGTPIYFITFLEALTAYANDEDKDENDENEKDDNDGKPGGAGPLQTSRRWRTQGSDELRRRRGRNESSISRHHSHLVHRS